MKIISIGDIHGKQTWKEIVDQEQDADKFVFIGDYFDSFDSKAPQQIDNFKQILEFKKENLNEVVLLFGNHDFHYLQGVDEYYSGFQPIFKHEISEILNTAINEELVQMCYSYNEFLFSHAGFTKTWLRNSKYGEFTEEELKVNLQKEINDYFRYSNREYFRFTIGRNFSNVGDDITQSPIWVRPNSLRKDKIDYFTQIVGHTRVNTIEIIDDVILIDVLDKKKEYLVIEDGNIITKEIN